MSEKCSTDCREDLLETINGKNADLVTLSHLKWIIGTCLALFISFAGITHRAYSVDQKITCNRIEKTETRMQAISHKIIVVQLKLETILSNSHQQTENQEEILKILKETPRGN